MNGALLQNTLLLGTSATLLAGLASVAVLLLSLVLPQRWARWIPVLAGINLLLPQFLYYQLMHQELFLLQVFEL
mgnify:CR=1 FL=1